jgi:hypothetical protein
MVACPEQLSELARSFWRVERAVPRHKYLFRCQCVDPFAIASPFTRLQLRNMGDIGHEIDVRHFSAVAHFEVHKRAQLDAIVQD